jgi:alkylhydroperoxidase family enzyme
VPLGRARSRRAAIAAAREAGLSEAAVLEVLAHVALNVLTNYVNIALETEVDFPVVEARRAA